MAATEDCAHRACFRIAEVTVMHSVVIRATGSTATDIRAGGAAGTGDNGIDLAGVLNCMAAVNIDQV